MDGLSPPSAVEADHAAAGSNADGLALTSIISGGVGFLISIFGIIAGPLAIVTGIMALKRGPPPGSTPRTLAIIGIVLGSLTILFLLVAAALFLGVSAVQ